MERIESLASPGVLLHLIHRGAEGGTRVNLVPDHEFLQVAVLRYPGGHSFKAHRHLAHDRVTTIPQESWVVIRGSVRGIYYDLDDTVIAERELYAGDCSVTLRGGHNLVILEDDTLVYEHKTGPFVSSELDKTFI